MSTNKFFFEIHSNLPREGPGSDASTLRALNAIPHLPKTPHIADIGCGTGKATLLLAKHTGGEISALDIHQPFLDHLLLSAKAQNTANQIHILQGDMAKPPYLKEAFDLIWSEGAIYILGLEMGLHTWQPFLKPAAYIAFSHLSWLTESPSRTALEFWQREYPAIEFIEKNISVIENAGFKLINSFSLPKSDWWDEYYGPMEKRIVDLRNKYQNNAEAMEAARTSQEEIDVWKQEGDDYGYVFYIAQKL